MTDEQVKGMLSTIETLAAQLRAEIDRRTQVRLVEQEAEVRRPPKVLGG